jgi:hypothetical protein
MASKDYFSEQSKIYAAFRPTYPDELYQFILDHLQHRDAAWDCATGNGQVAQHLAGHFDKVYATDISHQQIEHAYKADNIEYSVCKAEQTPFAKNLFDLITIAQALHWINTEEFYQEVKRTARPGALLAVWGYALLSIDHEIDVLFLDFYHRTVGPYWDDARKMVEEEYRSVPFPFQEIPAPKFQLTVGWVLEQFAGYLRSWSATQKYIKVNDRDPVPFFIDAVKKYWKPGERKTVTFPIFVKIGKVF